MGVRFTLPDNYYATTRWSKAVYYSNNILTFSPKYPKLGNYGLTDSAEILRALSEGHTQVLQSLYEQHRPDFFRWAGRRIECGRPEMEDAWQEAVFAFYEQAASRKLTAFRYNARTWLFAVGYRKLLNQRRKTKWIFWKDEIDDALVRDPVFQQFPGEEPGAEEQASLLASLEEMSPQCRNLLRQRFFFEKSIPEIQQLYDYQSANALSVSLSRCLKRLKELFREKAGI